MPYPTGFNFDDVPGDRPIDNWCDDVYDQLDDDAYQAIEDGTWIGNRLKNRLDETSSTDDAGSVAQVLNELYHSLKETEDDD